MKAKSLNPSFHKAKLTTRSRTSGLKERRLYELDRGYLRQLQHLSQIVWTAKLERDLLTKSLPESLRRIRSRSNHTTIDRKSS